jgi:hypothetical protein
MTDLVYQTTLGGNLTLRATNTASNPIITIPAVTANLVTTGDIGTVTTSMLTSTAATQSSYNQGGTGSVSRTIQTKLQETVSVKDFGAVGDGTTDDTAAIQNAINYSNTLSGAEIFFPSGNYKSNKLTVYSNVTLRGQTSLEGGSTNLYATGSQVFATPIGSGFHSFNLYNLAIQGVRGVTDFIDQSGGGSWAYSTIANCYIVNIRNFYTLTTGNHFLNNNFQNMVSMVIRGGDYSFQGNFIGYDDQDTTKGSSDSLLSLTSSTGVDFSGNYLTSVKTTNAPIVLTIENSSSIRILSNWIDGGQNYGLAITSGSYLVSANFNRFGVIYPSTCIPIILSNVTDVNINENQIGGLNANAPFIGYGSTLSRCKVLNNITNSRSDSTTHDYDTATKYSGVQMIGPYLSVKDVSISQDIVPPLYGRTLINQNATGLVFYYVYSTQFTPGDYFNFNRTNTSQRLIIRDGDTSTNIYDSNTSGFNVGRVICYISNTLAVEKIV